MDHGTSIQVEKEREDVRLPLTSLTDEEELLQATVRQFAQERIAPAVKEMDEAGVFRRELIDEFFQLGLMSVEIPETFGGSSSGFLSCIVTIEELAAVDPSAAVIVD